MLFLRVFPEVTVSFHLWADQVWFDAQRVIFYFCCYSNNSSSTLVISCHDIYDKKDLERHQQQQQKKLSTCKLLFVIKRYNNCCSILYTFFSVFSKMFTPPEQQRPFTVTVTTKKGCRHGGAFEERAQSCGGTLWSNIRGWGCMGAGLRYKEHFTCFLLLLLL